MDQINNIQQTQKRGRKRMYPEGYTSWDKAKALAESRKEIKNAQPPPLPPNFMVISAFVETLTKEEIVFLFKEIKNRSF